MGRKWRSSNKNDLGSTLAACIVIVIGTGFCLLLALAGGDNDKTPWMVGGVCTVAVAFFGFIIWLRNGHAGNNLSFWLSLKRNPRDDGLASQYRPRKVPTSRSTMPEGANQPITAEEVHEIRVTSSTAWVPTKDRRYATDDIDDE